VFETDEKAAQSFEVAPAGTPTTAGVTFGQPVWFIGYPFGMSSSFPANGSGITALPFMKRGSMSAVDASNPDAVVYYIDGFNNPGFSGGPVVYWEFATHTYKILAVVKGYRNDTAKVLINGKQIDSSILVNSGIIVSYSIRHAIDAIKKSLSTTP
jgi:Trypsin-like peptidase domain